MKTKKGFTLVELLVVVAIIGLLSTLGVVAFRDAQKKARDTKRLGDMRAIAGALAMANNEGGLVLCSATNPANPTCAASATPVAGTSLVYSLILCPSATGCAAAGTVNTQFIDMTALKDPMSSAGTTVCAAGATAPCQYTLVSGTTLDNYTIGFYTEQLGSAIGLGSNTNYHTLTQTGVIK